MVADMQGHLVRLGPDGGPSIYSLGCSEQLNHLGYHMIARANEADDANQSHMLI